jgi:hypothetical protein
MRATCLQLLHSQSTEQTAAVVVSGLEEAVSATAELQQKSTQAVWWLLDTALAPGTAAELLQHTPVINSLQYMPNVPLHLAQGLCQRGLCMPYASIVAAACGKGRVAGAWTRGASIPQEFCHGCSNTVGMLSGSIHCLQETRTAITLICIQGFIAAWAHVN